MDTMLPFHFVDQYNTSKLHVRSYKSQNCIKEKPSHIFVYKDETILGEDPLAHRRGLELQVRLSDLKLFFQATKRIKVMKMKLKILNMFYNYDEANLLVMLSAQFLSKTNHHQLVQKLHNPTLYDNQLIFNNSLYSYFIGNLTNLSF